MPSINAAMLAVSSSPAASILVKVTVTTGLGLMGAWLARRSRAAVRHALLAAAFGVLLVLPIVALVAPPIRIALAPAAQERVATTSAGVAETIPRVAGVGVTPGVPRSAGLSLPGVLLAGWIAGMVLFLAPVGMGLWQVRSLRRTALPWRHAMDAGIRRRVEVLLHEALPGPMTCGVLHPAIVLPRDAEGWDAEDLNRAMVHELEHVRRGDSVSRCFARVLCAVYWFHPLVWMAWRKLMLEAERSCDDAVLGRSEATAYADQLAGLAARLSTARRPALLAMANRADLAARVGAVLDGRLRRGRAGRLRVALACLAAVVLVFTMAPLSVVAAPQAAGTTIDDQQIAEYVHRLRLNMALRFSATTRLIVEDVVVPDMTGRNIEGLNFRDFAVTEDGVPQTIEVFEPQKLGDLPRNGLTNGPTSLYILGYYTTNQNVDGKYREVKITRKDDPLATLKYRAGYYAEIASGGDPSVDPNVAPDPALPALIYKTEALYSEEARKAKWQGTSTLSVDVDASGEPTNVQVIRALGLGLDEKAVNAVKQWRFRPGMKDGQPVTMQVQVDVLFRLL